MFMHGELTERFMDDFRPEVHDSDGLIIETGTGERIWRPLINPLGLRISTFQVENPRMFGLLQRDRDFAHYQDLEAHYHNRPSAQVEPIGDWGKGVVELVEIPSTRSATTTSSPSGRRSAASKRATRWSSPIA
jgi:periplasmic glucans biosynthesis protein